MSDEHNDEPFQAAVRYLVELGRRRRTERAAAEAQADAEAQAVQRDQNDDHND